MKRIHLILLPVLLLAVAAAAAAQSRDVLNVIELRQVVASPDPVDHGRLGAHFAALADTYTSEAARHDAMALALAGNPNRFGAVSASAHCARLAVLNRESAATLRALAAHHERLARGEASTAPIDAARFENGEGAPAPSARELAAFAANARTPDDHRTIAEYFLTVAERHTQEADAHTAMAATYRGIAARRVPDGTTHCERLAKSARAAAKEALGAATTHAQLANIG